MEHAAATGAPRDHPDQSGRSGRSAPEHGPVGHVLHERPAPTGRAHFARAPAEASELDAWSTSIVATALKILWVLPGDRDTDDLRRRIARAEAMRSARSYYRGAAHRRGSRTGAAPVPDAAATPDTGAHDTISAG